jgi:sigma-E factor negative regulatory protein RseA
MTDTHRENLSAGMDGELTQEELRFLLRRLDHDAALQQAWSRYHVARDGLRRQLPPLASEGFSARVMLAIGQETAVAAGSGRRRPWLRWSAGGAIAATVAVAALLVTQPAGPGGDGAAPQVAASGNVRPASAQASATAMRVDTPAAAPAWLNNYAGLPSALTQQASATVDGGEGATFLYSRNRQNPYQLDRYRAINNGDGSYLLLMPPAQRAPQAPQLEPQAQ